MKKPYEKAKYRVILVSYVNDEVRYIKTLYRSRTRESSFIRFNKLKAENKVTYPKRFVNTKVFSKNGIYKKTIKPIIFNICVIKVTEENDVFRKLRDQYGKIYVEKPLGEWTILNSEQYEIEEKFWIYGFDPNICRPTIKEVVRKIMTGAHGKKTVKQVIVVQNKLIIYSEDQFDMVLCKNIEESQRLHHTLSKIIRKQKVKSILFMGTASKSYTSVLYDLIQEKTGWDKLKITRSTTRP